jgi:hypothetical protein
LMAGASTLTSILLYALGAQQAAIIELSVGAGLVFILFVFAISLAGETGPTGGLGIPRSVALCGVGLVVLLLGELAWPHIPGVAPGMAVPLSISLWAGRQLDILVQIVLIFAGALTIMGLLAQDKAAGASQTTTARSGDELLEEVTCPARQQTPRTAAGTLSGLRTSSPARVREESPP